MYSKIVNPKTGRKVNVNSVFGKKILRKYLSVLKGGASSQWASGGASAEERPLRCPDTFPISCGKHNVFADPDARVNLCGTTVFECITQSDPDSLIENECDTIYTQPNERCSNTPAPFAELITTALDQTKWGRLPPRSGEETSADIVMFSHDVFHRLISLILYSPGALARFNDVLRALCKKHFGELPILELRAPGNGQAGFFIDLVDRVPHFHFYGRQSDNPRGDNEWNRRRKGAKGFNGGPSADLVAGKVPLDKKDSRSTRWGHYKWNDVRTDDVMLREDMLDNPLNSGWVTREVMNLLVFILRNFRRSLEALGMNEEGRDYRRPGEPILRPAPPAPVGTGFAFAGGPAQDPGGAAGAPAVAPAVLQRFRDWEEPDSVRGAASMPSSAGSHGASASKSGHFTGEGAPADGSWRSSTRSGGAEAQGTRRAPPAVEEKIAKGRAKRRLREAAAAEAAAEAAAAEEAAAEAAAAAAAAPVAAPPATTTFNSESPEFKPVVTEATRISQIAGVFHRELTTLMNNLRYERRRDVIATALQQEWLRVRTYWEQHFPAALTELDRVYNGFLQQLGFAPIWSHVSQMSGGPGNGRF